MWHYRECISRAQLIIYYLYIEIIKLFCIFKVPDIVQFPGEQFELQRLHTLCESPTKNTEEQLLLQEGGITKLSATIEH